MGIPDYQSVMLPLLKLAGDELDHSIREVIETLAEQFALTDEDRNQLLPSGRQRTFDNRVGWARTYMHKAGLLESPRRGAFHITPRGLQVIGNPPSQVNVKYLEQFPEFLEFRNTSREPTQSPEAPETTSDQTPEESLEAAYQKVHDDLASEILQMVKDNPPQFFERVVVDLLVRMGYGGTLQDAGRAIGRSGDEGIDGVINEDRLGLDTVYIQAKRWQGPVGRPEVQRFAGALQGQRSHKGIMLTTSSFTKDAQDYVSRIESKIILIDGPTLSQLMVDYNVGVSPIASYEIKKVDSDYFTDV